ncbi:MAG: sodium:calcium antiporter [Myxococcota bacterium]
MLDLALLGIGLAAVALGARLTIDSSVVLARRYGLSDFVIGVVILAVGSDLPELVVSISASLHNLSPDQDTSGLIVGNAIGSCFGQFGMVLGIAGLIGHLSLARQDAVTHGPVLLGTILMLLLAGLDGQVSRLEGAILAATYVLYVVSLLNDPVGEEEPAADLPTGRAWRQLGVGLVVVAVSAEVIVRAAVALADAWGVSQAFIGIAIIGVGTSIPELSISLVALSRSRGHMSVGNLVGSNVLDVLLPVGLGALIAPIRVDPSLLWFDLPALFGLTAAALLFFVRDPGMHKRRALALLGLYAAYLGVKIVEAG